MFYHTQCRAYTPNKQPSEMPCAICNHCLASNDSQLCTDVAATICSKPSGQALEKTKARMNLHFSKNASKQNSHCNVDTPQKQALCSEQRPMLVLTKRNGLKLLLPAMSVSSGTLYLAFKSNGLFCSAAVKSSKQPKSGSTHKDGTELAGNVSIHVDFTIYRANHNLESS